MNNYRPQQYCDIQSKLIDCNLDICCYECNKKLCQNRCTLYDNQDYTKCRHAEKNQKISLDT